MGSEKLYISCDQLRDGSIILARKIYDSKFFYEHDKPKNFLLGIWRGGTYPGIFVHEFLDYLGLSISHFPIKTEFYRGIDRVNNEVKVWGLSDIIDVINADDRVVIIDDVWDRGWSLCTVLNEIKERARKNAPQTRTAVVFYKPEKNETDLEPDFSVVKTNKWIVFPHELKGLTREEIVASKPNIFEKMLFEKDVASFEEDYIKSMQ